MRFALVGPTIEENLSIAYLAAALKTAGHDATIESFVDDADHKQVAERIACEAPDAVGLSMSFQRRAPGYVALASDLREAGFTGHICAGGHFASVVAEDLLLDHPQLDSVVRGEAEAGIVALADALSNGGKLAEVPGIVYRSNDALLRGPQPHKPCDLDALALPVRDAPPVRQIGIPIAPVLASRGCEASCTFCSIATFGKLSKGPARRVRSVQSIAAEMGGLWRERDVRIFVFHDDDFFSGDHEADLERIVALRHAMANVQLPPVALVVKARPDDLSEALLLELREAGLVRLFLGIETHAAPGLKALGRQLSPQASWDALTMLHRLDIFVCSNLLLWEPDTTLDDLRANIGLMAAFPDQLFNLSRTEPYEGAPLTRRLAKRERLLGDYLGRDYVVADARAELAWRLFRVAMGDRCFPMDGVINSAMGLACDSQLLRRFVPGPQSESVAAEVRAFVRTQSESTSGWLERIVDYAADAPLGQEPEVLLHALDIAREVRAQDASFIAEMRVLREAIDRCANPPRLEPLSPPEHHPRLTATSPVLARFTVAAAAAASVAGCPRTPSNPPSPDGGVTVTVDTGSPTGSTTATISDDDPGDGTATLRLTPRSHFGEYCSEGKQRFSGFHGEAQLRDSQHHASFHRVEVADGKVSDTYVSPDGRRVKFMFAVGEKKGRQRITAIFKRPEQGAGVIRATHYVYQYGDGKATVGRDPQPEPKCGIVCDPAAPPPDNVLSSGKNVVFTHSARRATKGWAMRFNFGFGLRESIKGTLVGDPEVRCNSGVVSKPTRISQWRSKTPGNSKLKLRDRYDVSYDPRPADGSGKLKAGTHTCTVRYRVKAGKGEIQVEGKLQVHVAADGTVSLGRGRDGGARFDQNDDAPQNNESHPDLPLPLRYGIKVKPVEQRSDAVLLGAECPAAYALGTPSFRWSASAGVIEPLPDGAQALWHLDEADQHDAVAVCAVQAVPYDLQIGCYRPAQG